MSETVKLEPNNDRDSHIAVDGETPTRQKTPVYALPEAMLRRAQKHPRVLEAATANDAVPQETEVEPNEPPREATKS